MTRFLLLPFLFVAISGHAATLVVDTTTTAPALNACTAAPLDCSFAGALSLANQDAAQDTIAFAIPFTEAGCDPVLLSCFVSLVSAPPLSVTQPVIIDGTTQPGHVANSLSAVNGGLKPEDIKVAVTGNLERGGSIIARVTVTMPALAVPGLGTFAPWEWTAVHTERVDEYRSLQ